MAAVSPEAREKQKARKAAYARSARGQYAAHKAQAKNRGIEFKLTFEQWSTLWTASGKYDRRGKQPGDYCMSRNGDHGAYEVGNVKIVRVQDNLIEQLESGSHCSYRLTNAQFLGILEAWKSGETQTAIAKKFGVSQPYVSRLISGQRGTLLNGVSK